LNLPGGRVLNDHALTCQSIRGRTAQLYLIAEWRQEPKRPRIAESPNRSHWLVSNIRHAYRLGWGDPAVALVFAEDTADLRCHYSRVACESRSWVSPNRNKTLNPQNERPYDS
jgi:hypothetical protein